MAKLPAPSDHINNYKSNNRSDLKGTGDLQMRQRNTVVVGGGTGSYTVLTGLKRYTSNLTAVVTMSDDGGSSGKLRDEFGHLPPGDVRRCLVALSANQEIGDTLRALFEYRFDKGDGLNGHNFGNLLLTALMEITGSMELAILEASRLLNVRGRVLPVTTDDVRLCARLEDGTVIRGEKNIDVRTENWLKGRAERVTPCGSALKFCLLARGEADLYPRFGRTMEWDTAAGHAILSAAGGSVRTLDGADLTYGKPGMENPFFLARGKDAD